MLKIGVHLRKLLQN